MNKKFKKLKSISFDDENEVLNETNNNDTSISNLNIEKNSINEEEKLKLLNIKKLSNKEIIKKSIKISLKNWRKSVYQQIQIFITQIFSMYLPILKANIIDSISTNKGYDELIYNFKKYIFFLIVRLIFDEILEIFEYYFIRKYNNEYKDLLLENIIEKDISFFDIFETGELTKKLNDYEENIEEDFVYKILTIIQNIFKLFLISNYLFITSFNLTIVLIFVFFVNIIFSYIIEKCSIFSNFEEIMKTKELYSKKLNELISNIRMIKSFGKEKDELKKIKEYKRKSSFDYNLLTTILFNISILIKDGGEAITLFFAGKFILKNKFSIGKFTVFKQYQEDFSECYSDIKSAFKDFKTLIYNWRNFFDLYDYPVKIKSLKNYIPQKLIGKIKFENITFSYPLKPNVNILKNLSFEIEPGKIFAICGFSGSGKTTISNLIQRFYDPNEGKIYIDDIDLKDYNLNFLRKNIGFVSQEPILNSGTIEENILYGIDYFKKKDFEKILKISNVDSFVYDKNLFPEGIKTLVGEKGIKMSGGEKQRIAIARALIKNSKILIFDEATSALDSENEKNVQRAIDQIIKEKGITTIIIAHRLSTLINANKIIVMDKGKVVEFGNHIQLLQKNGQYKKLFYNQLIENQKEIQKK